MLIWLLIIVLGMPSPQSLGAQEIRLSLLQTDTSEVPIDLSQDRFSSKRELDSFLVDWRNQQLSLAYWEASIDTIIALDTFNYQAYLHRGEQYRWSNLEASKDIPVKWLSKAGFRSKLFRDKPLDHAGWIRIRDSLTAIAANNGYPFASAHLENVKWTDDYALSADIVLDRDSLLHFGKLRIPETAGIKTNFLERYLGIAENMPFSRSALLELPKRIQRLAYLKQTGEPTLSFRNNIAILDLPIAKKAASKFDFVIGVLPATGAERKLLITGELNGELQNGLGLGERIAVAFRQLRAQTQSLQLALDYPYLLSLPFGLSLEGELYKQDTQFININYRIAATYNWRTTSQVDVFWSRKQTNLLGFDEATVVQNNRLPDTLDVSRSFFGLSITKDQTDQLFNPSNGYSFEASIAAGNRRIRRNGKLLDLGLGEQYDSLNLNTAQYNVAAKIAYYRPLFSGTVLFLGVNAAAFLSSEPLLANEQFRLGGAKLLRGFDEQQIFASAYSVFTSEFRVLLGQDAYIYAFGDFAYINPRNQSKPDIKDDYPLGFGGGISFNSRAGVFAVSLALGRRSGEVLDLGQPKVHFGYLSVF